MPKQKKQSVNVDTLVNIAKDLKPRDPDLQYIGEEPKFLTQPEKRNLSVITGLAWYNRFYGRKEAKEFILSFLEKENKTNLHKKFKSVPEGEVKQSYGWMARLSLRGLNLTEQEKEKLFNEIDSLINVHSKDKSNDLKKETESNRPNVQEIMKERTREAGGELEGFFDTFLLEGAKKDVTFKVIDEVSKKNVLPQHINLLVEPWKQKQEEFLELQKGKDDQLNEAYGHYSKTQVKNILSFIDKVLSDLNGYANIKKAARAPRKRKAVPVEKLVSKLKYCRQFKDTGNKLDLVSLPPTKLHGASEAWVYDTAKRKMHHYVADEYAKTFGVKGNTLLGFDEKQSEVKTLRKPYEQIKELTGSKPAARKYFKDIKAVSTTPNGRFNENMVILKAF